MDATRFARGIWNAVALFVRRFHAAETGQAGISVILVTLAGSTVLATATLTDGSFAFEGFEEIYHAGVARVSGSLEVRGSVVATASGSPPRTETIQLTLGSFGNGNAVSLQGDAPAEQRLVISYTDSKLFSPSVPYTATEFSGDGDGLLEPGELALITIQVADLGDAAAVIAANERWTLELISPLGGSVQVSRTMPFALQPVMRLP